MDEAGDAGQASADQDGAELADAEQDGGKRGSMLPLLIVGIIGLGGGAAVGGKALGAKVGEELARREIDGGGGGGDHGGVGGEGSIHIVDNLIVNPAETAGRRFLLTTIALQLNSPDDVEILAARDVELRDTLIIVLGTKTVEELNDITRRSLIVEEIFHALEHITGPEVIHRVFLPQFVVQ